MTTNPIGSSASKVPVSVVIITKNEEKKIEDCLKSVHGWADEIILVDDESSDRTLDITEKYADKILKRKMDLEGRHRNWAYAQARNLWVMSLDADERVSTELREEIRQHLSGDQDISIYSIPIKTYVGTHWMRYAGWYPASKLRLFKKNCFSYEEEEVHPKANYQGNVLYLNSDILHYAYKDLDEFFNRLSRQTTLEARKWFRTGRKMSFFHAVWRAKERFLKRYFLKKGYKDGLYGFSAAIFDSIYQILSYVKYRELQKNNET